MTTLRRSIWLVALAFFALAAGACVAESDGGPDLNPQPLPPNAPPEDPADKRGSASEAPESSSDGNFGGGGSSSGGSSGSSGAGSPPPAPSPDTQKDGGAPTGWQLYQLVPKR